MTGSEDVAAAKQELRTRAKRNRAGLQVDHRRIQAGLSRFLATAPVGWVVGFAALKGEPDLAPLLAGEVGEDLGPFGLTRTPEAGMDLTVHPADSPSEMHPYGFPQPVASSPQLRDAEIAVVLVPGLAFGRSGERLGFGAGYYDRFLGRLGESVLRVGVSDGFVIDNVPVDAHDVPMTHLATEIGVVSLPL